MHIGRWQLVLAAILFSTGGLAIKSVALSNWQVASFRSLIAAAAVLAFLPAARRGWSRALAGPAAAYAATLVLFVSANKLTTSANAIFLQSTAPLYLAVLGPLVLREPNRRADWFTLLVIGAGLSLFFVAQTDAQATAPNPAFGNLLATASGVTWALLLVSLRYVGKQDPSGNSGLAVVAMGNLLAGILCLPLALPVVASAPKDWAILGYLGVFQIGVAYVLMTKGMRHVPALEGSMILLVEPALNPVWTAALLTEYPGTLPLLGGLLILGGTVLRMWISTRQAASLPRPAGSS